MRALLARFGDDTGGNFAVMFALMLLPLTMAAGMGVDYARSIIVRDKMKIVAEETARMAVAGATLPVADRERVARQRFDQLAGFYKIASPDLGLEQSFRASGVATVVDVTVRTRTPLYFGRLFGERERELAVSLSSSNHAEVRQKTLVRCHAAGPSEYQALNCSQFNS